MSILLAISILFRLSAFSYSVYVLFRIRDSRLAFVSLLLALMTVGQLLRPIFEHNLAFSTRFIAAELPGLGVSVLALLAVIFVARMIEEHRAALRSRENLYRVIEQTSDLVATANDEGVLQYVNPAGRRLLGLDQSEPLNGRQVREFYPPEIYQRIEDEVLPHVRQKGVWGGELPLQALDGSPVPTHAVVMARSAADGTGEAYSTIMRDMTALLRTEAELREREAALQVMTDQLPAVLWTTDESLVMTSMRGAILDRIGLSAEDYVGRHITEVATQGPDGPGVIAHRRALEGATASYALSIGGRTFECSVRPLVNASGKLSGVIGVGMDVTETAEAQQDVEDRDAALRLVTDQVPAIIWTTDEELRVTYIRGAALRLVGNTPADVVGTRIHDWTEEGEDSVAVRAHRKALAGEPTSYTYGLRDHWFECVVEPLGDKATERSQLVGVALEMTDALKAQRELEMSRESLRNLAIALQRVRERERSEIARNLHDALGQRLTGLRMELWHCIEKSNDADFGEDATRLIEHVDESLTQVQEISWGLRSPLLDDVGLADALRTEFEQFGDRTGCAMTFRSTIDGLERRYDRDTAVYRIIQEALTNVTRHADATGIDVTVDRDGDWLVARLCDDGCGIAPESVVSVSSLGLIGMRERAAALGGSADVRPATRGGTEVRIRIPLEPTGPA